MDIFRNAPMTVYYDKNGKVKYIDRYEYKWFGSNELDDMALIEFSPVTGKPKRAYRYWGGTIIEFDQNGNAIRQVKAAPGVSKQDILTFGRTDTLDGTPKNTATSLHVLYTRENGIQFNWVKTYHHMGGKCDVITILKTTPEKPYAITFDRSYDKTWRFYTRKGQGYELKLLENKVQMTTKSVLSVPYITPKLKS